MLAWLKDNGLWNIIGQYSGQLCALGTVETHSIHKASAAPATTKEDVSDAAYQGLVPGAVRGAICVANALRCHYHRTKGKCPT